MRGRKPKPTSIKRLEGNPGKRPLNHNEPLPPDDMPERPAGLTGQARKAWERLAPAMHTAGILTEIDADGLESYCRLYAHARACWREAKKTGLLVNNAGRAEISLFIREAHKTETLLHKLRSELGLNATSRSRINTSKSSSEEDLEDLIKFDP